MPDGQESYTSSSHNTSMILNRLLSSSVELSTGECGRGTSCRVLVERGSWLLLCCASCSTAAMKVVFPAVLLFSCAWEACGRVEAAGETFSSRVRWSNVKVAWKKFGTGVNCM